MVVNWDFNILFLFKLRGTRVISLTLSMYRWKKFQAKTVWVIHSKVIIDRSRARNILMIFLPTILSTKMYKSHFRRFLTWVIKVYDHKFPFGNSQARSMALCKTLLILNSDTGSCRAMTVSPVIIQNVDIMFVHSILELYHSLLTHVA